MQRMNAYVQIVQAGCGSGQPGLLVGDLHIAGGWDWMSTVGLCNPAHSMILWFIPACSTWPQHNLTPELRCCHCKMRELKEISMIGYLVYTSMQNLFKMKPKAESALGLLMDSNVYHGLEVAVKAKEPLCATVLNN